jgi:hypothetical protein
MNHKLEGKFQFRLRTIARQGELGAIGGLSGVEVTFELLKFMVRD